jgi:hypothetical protein
MRVRLVVVMAGSRWMKTRWTLIPVDHSVVYASKNRFVRFCMLMTTFVMKYNYDLCELLYAVSFAFLGLVSQYLDSVLG